MLGAYILDEIPQLTKMVPENVLLSGGQMIPASRLKGLDLVFRHVDEERKIRGIPPETNWNHKVGVCLWKYIASTNLGSIQGT